MRIKDLTIQICLLFLFNLTLKAGFIETSDTAGSKSGTYYEPDNKYIQYTGRFDFTNVKKPKFWAAGTYIKAKYKGDSCTFLLADNYLYGKYNNYIEVVIDDTILKRIQTKPGKSTYTFGRELAYGKHTIVICKNTESNIGYLEFSGLRVHKLLRPDDKPGRKIEFIGNSITCGTGSDISGTACGTHEWFDQHNAYLSYGPLTARALNAQWYLSSVSGIGLVHSCCGMKITMYDVYGNIGFNQAPVSWDFNRYIPDVVTICLGQNDGIQDSADFCHAYIDLIEEVRSHYPAATIICLSSPMADNGLTHVLKNYLKGIVHYENKIGEPNIYYFFFSKKYNSGCGGHPDLNEHAMIAKELTPFIKTKMNW